MEVSVSSHVVNKKAIAKELINGTIAYNKFANRSEDYLPENRNGLPDIVPAQANVSIGKDNTIIPGNQITLKVFEIDEGVNATENPDGSYSLNTRYAKSELKKGDALVKKLNLSRIFNVLVTLLSTKSWTG